MTRVLMNLISNAYKFTPSGGTSFIIRLKFRLASREDLPQAEEDSEQSAPENIDFTGKRVLLVEDNMINMEIANMILTQLGFEVDTAENGQIAVDKVTASAPGFYDAILMDIQMPVMDGYTATKAIRALSDDELSSIPILAMTANAFEEDVQAARDAGMQSHIAKPVDVSVLIAELTKVLYPH